MTKIPESARCVWKGKLFSVWEREQKMFDGTTQIFESVKRFDSIQGIMVKDGNIVLPYEIQPHQSERNYGFRGGMMEDGEVPDEAMSREFLEETGMQGDIQYWMTLSKGGAVKREENYYIIRHATKVQEPRFDGGEKIEMREMSFDEFLDILMQPGFRNGNFAGYIAKSFLVPGKKEELRKIIFG